MNTTETPDPTTLSLADLRGLRQQLQLEDDAVSYARRVAQARLDLVKVEQMHRSDVEGGGAADDLRAVLSQHLTGGPARPPRPTEDLSDHPLAVELDELCARLGFGHLKELDDTELMYAIRIFFVSFILVYSVAAAAISRILPRTSCR